MRYVRLLHPLHWHDAKKRFASNAFTNSAEDRGGGISVVDPECAKARSGSICAHVGEFYHKFSVPVILWEIDSDDLPNHEARIAPTHEGDDCHMNIYGLSDGQATKFFRRKQESGQAKFLICTSAENQPEPVTDASRTGWLFAHMLAT